MARKNLDIDDYSSVIAPDGDYSAYNGKTGATGRYGFSWNAHASDIKKITGVKDRAEFLQDQDAQDKYFSWHIDHNVKPAMERLKDLNKADLGDAELAKLVHSKGETGAKRWLKENTTPVAPITTPATQNKPIADHSQVPQDMSPLTYEERDKFEKMQGEAYKQGFLGDDHNRQPGVDFMIANGISPSRLAAHQQDFLQKQNEAPMAGVPTVRAGADGFSLADNFYGDKTAQQRYVQYQLEQQGQPVQDFGSNRDALIAAQNALQAKKLDEFKGFDDPTQDVNYVPPGTQSGFGHSPGGGSAPANPAPAPDPNFPTRDPTTGRVTPAVNQRVKKPIVLTGDEEDNDANDAPRLKFEDLQKLPKKDQIEILDKFHGDED